MQPHPDFAQTELPRQTDLDGYVLTPLTAAQTEEDYAAVIGSAHVLTDVFGDWPEGLTLEGNRTDLAWHDNEFILRRSFSWIIRDTEAAYLGCFYVFPEPGQRGAASAVIWLRAQAKRDALARDLIPRLQEWAAAHMPQTVALTWTFSPRLDA